MLRNEKEIEPITLDMGKISNKRRPLMGWLSTVIQTADGGRGKNDCKVRRGRTVFFNAHSATDPHFYATISSCENSLYYIFYLVLPEKWI